MNSYANERQRTNAKILRYLLILNRQHSDLRFFQLLRMARLMDAGPALCNEESTSTWERLCPKKEST